jgi:16S rRNA (adenine1518-N6/adenine1519-N6)-dimethyltransferase
MIIEAVSDYIRAAPPSESLTVKVVSNLPYYISTPVIIDLLQEVLPIKTMILMLQRDTTDRMKAQPGTRNYGVLSIMTKLFADAKVLKKLPPDVFWPVPLVDSAIVKMEVNQHRHADRILDFQNFKNVVHAIYISRRKTLLNSLSSLCSGLGMKDESKEIRKDLASILEHVGIKPKSRGEELDIEALISLSNGISEYLSSKKQSAPP